MMRAARMGRAGAALAVDEGHVRAGEVLQGMDDRLRATVPDRVISLEAPDRGIKSFIAPNEAISESLPSHFGEGAPA